MKPRILLFSLLFAASAEAMNLVVPAGESLVVTSSGADPVPVMITFYGPDGHRTVETILVANTATIEVPPAATLIRISSAQPVTAHAANLRAVPIDALPTEAVMSGTVKVVNPWSVPASLVVTLRGEQQFHIVPPFETLQLDEASANVRITSNIGVYAYDDRAFVVPVQTPATVEPRCAEPAPLAVANPGQQPAEGWVVIKNTDDEPPAFLDEVTPEQLAGLRCESSVQLIAQNVTH